MGAEGIVEEDAIGYVLLEAYIKGNGLIKGLLVLPVGVGVRDPVVHPLPFEVRMGGLVPHAVVAFPGLADFTHLHHIAPIIKIFLPMETDLVPDKEFAL